MLQVEARFDREKLDFEKDYEGHLMVTIKAPEDANELRTPIRAILVLDQSGSMGGRCPDGRTKMDALKDTSDVLLRNLVAKDEVAMVGYSDSVFSVQERVSAEKKEAIFPKVRSLRIIGNTNLSGGLLAGLEEAAGDFNGVRRVLLLTDGLPTAGVIEPARILDLVSKRSDKGVTISTFAFGNDADQELLANIAKEGAGNFYYITESKDVKSSFARELGGITSCKAQNIQIKVKPNKGNGNEVLEVLNDYNVKKEGEADSVAVIAAEDIYAGETKNVLIKFKVSKPSGKPKDRAFSVAHLEVSYNDATTGERKTEDFNVKVEFVKSEEADKESLLAVEEQVAIMKAAAAQLEAVAMANRGDFAGARMQFSNTSSMLRGLVAKGSDVAGEVAVCMSDAAVDFDEGVYTPTHANKYSNAAKGARKQRATGEGKMSDLYKTRNQHSMEENFDKAVTPEVPKQETQEKKPNFEKTKWKK